MIIRVLPEQIPRFWEVIKFAMSKANNLENNELVVYLNVILHELLNSKAQCWIRFNDDRFFMAICITGINVDKQTGEKKLILHCMYSFKAIDNDALKEELLFIKSYAENQKCSCICATSSNKRVWDLALLFGFTEKSRNFYLKIGE